MTKPQTRQLTPNDIEQLTRQGCSAQQWETVQVSPNLDITRIENVQFSGEVTIGAQVKYMPLKGDVHLPCGIRNARIHNCTFGDNVYVNHVKTLLANYNVQSDVMINDVHSLCVHGESAFGNGTQVRPVVEAGGREVKIYDTLTSQVAMMMAMFRNRPKLIDNLNAMVDRFVQSVRSSTGLIANGARITHCGTLENLKVGPHAIIDGAAHLENGSINSTAEDPATIGVGVIARNFICSSGSQITDQVIIEECFVGQGVQLGLQYSTKNSLFFANCEGFHGEACSIFAGPYTVTHHKSTLLIAGLFSFMNAGSGSNQSNHKYKLGPVHQGIMERGCRLASDSYMMWPMKIGAFTLVMGQHYCNCNSSALPFSYLMEENGQSLLLPGMALRGIGTVRDGQKWAKRDRRKDPNILDKVMTDPINPYTAGKIAEGIDLLIQLKKKLGPEDTSIAYRGLTIKPASIETGLELYQLALDEYLGDCLIRHLQNTPEIPRPNTPKEPTDVSDWADLGGLIGLSSKIDDIIDAIENNYIDNFERLASRFSEIFDEYHHDEWAWATEMIRKYWNCPLEELTHDKMILKIKEVLDTSKKLTKMRLKDAQKEFALDGRVGFGMDNTEIQRDREFLAVRGNFQTNSFVQKLKGQLNEKISLVNTIIKDLSP
ncbi:MAG: DUF4954 family protein [Phycisphaerae bacterium]|nr:DUF4954 family protein [Phycisphaerae bacterium]